MRQAFDWREGNRLDLMVDGEHFFPEMLTAIDQARHSLLLEFYFVTSGQVAQRFSQALIAACRRGVLVKLIIDGFGARHFRLEDRRALERAGVSIVIFNPLQITKLTRNFARDHRKLLIVDHRLAFIGGTGLSDHYWLAQEPGCPWHELMVRVSGPVVEDLTALYNRLWLRCTHQRLPVSGAAFSAGGARCRLMTVQGFYHQEIKKRFLSQVHAAQERVWLMTAYFLPSLSVRSALRRAARRGLDVRLIIAGPYTDQPWVFHASKRYYRRLLKAGVRIFEYQPRFLHAKAALVDEWSSIGSCNLDHWNLRWNLEANLEVEDTLFQQQLSRVFVEDIEQCQEVTYEEWVQRPWHHKLKEYIWSVIGQLVLKIR